MSILKTPLKWLFSMSLSIFIFSCQMDEHMMIVEENSSNSEDDLLFLKSSSDNELGNWNILFEETFEGPNPFYTYVTTQFAESHSFRVSDSPSFKGENAGRFELRKSDDRATRTGKRAEILLEQPKNRENWYSFAVYLPSKGFERDSDDEVLTQWQNSGTPTISLRVVKDRFVFRVGHDSNLKTADWDHYDFGAIPKNEWINFVFHVVHSDNSEGLVEIWRNGNKVLTHSGPNNYRGERLPRWKVGIYKHSWASKSTDVDFRVLYYDNIRMGNYKASFSEMDPSEDNNKGWGPYVHEITSFTLVNSIGNKVLGTVPNNGIINIGPLDDNRITLRANLEDGFDGSVELKLEGPKSFTVIRNEAAYTLYGYDDGNYHNGGGTPKGTYTLTATPYMDHNKNGKVGTPVQLNFKIVDENEGSIIQGNVDQALDGDLIKIEEITDDSSIQSIADENETFNNEEPNLVSGNGLVGYWKMDERNSRTLTDHSGTGNHAKIENDSDVSWVSGIHGYALKTNGRLDRFSSVGHNSSINLSEAVTISAWIQPTKTARKQILSKGDGYEFMIYENGKLEFRVNRDTHLSDYRITSKTSYPTNGSTWMHVAVTFDGRKSTIYINGEEDVSETYDFTKINTNNSEVQIGAKRGDNRWTGALDEVRLYNRALSSSEIRDIYR